MSEKSDLLVNELVAFIDDLREENANLTARIAELEASLDVHKEIVVKYEEQRSEIIKLSNETVERLNSRIAELEAESERFTVHSNIKRQDDKSSNDTQPPTIVYGKESDE